MHGKSKKLKNAIKVQMFMQAKVQLHFYGRQGYLLANDKVQFSDKTYITTHKTNLTFFLGEGIY